MGNVMKEKKVGFMLRKIVTEQFATIESVLNEQENVQLSVGINFGISEENKILGCITHFGFITNDKPFILIQVKCEFEIDAHSWSGFINPDLNRISFPKGFLSHLAVITVGTVRGVLHAKTENTPFNQYFLPTINVTEFLKEDISFDLVTKE
jgi:hypothetical protein